MLVVSPTVSDRTQCHTVVVLPRGAVDLGLRLSEASLTSARAPPSSWAGWMSRLHLLPTDPEALTVVMIVEAF